MKMLKSLACAFAVLCLAPFLLAVEVTPEQAQTAARNWIRKNPRPMTAKLESGKGETRTVLAKEGRTLFHVLQLEGGGFVVMSGDTRISPLVCLSDSGHFDEGGESPLASLLRADMEQRLKELERNNAKGLSRTKTPGSGSGMPNDVEAEAELEWAELLGKKGDRPLSVQTKSIGSTQSLSDVRVAPLVKSTWDQSMWPSGQRVFNAKTPENAVCGCVATAGAQLMRYWQHPAAPILPGWYKCSINTALCGVRVLDSPYDWSSMPYSYQDANILSDAQIDAISRLTLEVGASVSMSYTTTKYGSSANTSTLVPALKETFNYASAIGYWPDASNYLQYGEAVGGVWKNAVFASLDAAMPVSVSLYGEAGGHSVLIDGYGFNSGNAYLHFNMGWSGEDNVWYMVLKEKLSHFGFTLLRGVNYNIHKTETGDVLSGRTVDTFGRPVANASVTLTTASLTTKRTISNEKGIWFFRITEPGTNFVSAAKETMTSSASRVIMNEPSSNFDENNRVGNRWGVDIVLEEPPMEQVETPVFSPEKGSFSGTSLSVTLSCATEGATIRYTTNGGVPTEASPAYSGTILVSGSTIIKAQAFKSGMRPSEVAEKRYERNIFQGASNLAAAVDCGSDVTFSADKDTSYVFGQTQKTYDGVDAIMVKSYVKSTGFAKLWGYPVLTAKVNGPGLLKFKCKTLPQNGYSNRDWSVTCSLDGTSKVSGAFPDWTQNTIAVTASGTRTVTWTPYGGMSSPTDMNYTEELFLLDEVEWIPGSVSKTTVSFDLNGAESGSLGSYSESLYPGENLTLPTGDGVERKGYLFGGWNTEPDGSGKSYWKGTRFTAGETDQCLYARWCKIVEIPFDYASFGGAHGYDLTQFKGSRWHGVGSLPSWVNYSAYDPIGHNFLGGGNNLANMSFKNGMILTVTAESNASDEPRSFSFGLLSEQYDTAPMFVCTQQGDASHILGYVTAECPESVVSGSETTLSCFATYRDGAVARVGAAWSIVSGGSYATVSSSGILNAGPVSSEVTITVRATYSEGGVQNVRSDREIRILPAYGLSDALPTTTTTSTGRLCWQGQTDISRSGGISARCGSCLDGSPWLEFTLPDGHGVSFEYRFSMGEGRALKIYDNGKNVAEFLSMADCEDWFRTDYVPEDGGAHAIRISYEWVADKSGRETGTDCCWVDNVVVAGIQTGGCRIELDRQSGNGGSASVNATYGEALPAITPPTRTGFAFRGYFTGTDGSGTKYYNADGSGAKTWDKVSGITLYACWEQEMWLYRIENDTAILTGSIQTTGALVIPTMLGGYPVVAIDDEAFLFCNGLVSVEIPGCVERIGEGAFASCSGLVSANIGKGVKEIGDYAFLSCNSLTAISMPDGVTDIGAYAFGSCSGLSFVSIPDSVMSIGEYAFSVCGSLTSVSIPGGVKVLGDRVFVRCGSLASVSLSEGLEEIGDYAFGSCASLASIVIPSSVREIGKNAFFNCSSLVSLQLGESVTSIGDGAFSFCDSLTTLKVPAGVTQIGKGAFDWCDSLSVLYLPNSFKTAEIDVPTGCTIQYYPDGSDDTTGGEGTGGSSGEGSGDAGGGSGGSGGSSGDNGGSNSAAASNGTAIQAIPAYKVAFNANGGTLPKGKKMAAQTLAYDAVAKLTKNAFTKKGWVFAGWATSKANAKKGKIAYTNAQKVSNLRTDGGTTTLYAVWAKPTYKVAFYANGGTGKMADQSFTYGKAKKLSANKFKAPNGKKFVGWAKSKSAAKKGQVTYKNKQKVKNLLITGKTVKLYAVWKKK